MALSLNDLGISPDELRKEGHSGVANNVAALLGQMAKATDKSGNAAAWRPMDVVALFDHSGSMSDEYRTGLIGRAAELAMAFAATLSRSGQARGMFFDHAVHPVREPITPSNCSQWMSAYAPPSFGTTNVSAALYEGVRMVAEVQNQPALLELIEAPLPGSGSSGFLGFGKRRAVNPPAPVRLERPAVMMLLFDGAPYVQGRNAEQEALEALIRISYTGIFVLPVFVANSANCSRHDYEDGKDFCDKMDELAARDPRMYTDNVDSVLYGDGVKGMTPEAFGHDASQELPEWLLRAVAKGVLAPYNG